MRYLLIPLAALMALSLANPDPAWAEGKKTGFDREQGQGNINNDNSNANPNNQGKTSVTGPHGQVKQGNFDCNNCEQDKPGKKR